MWSQFTNVTQTDRRTDGQTTCDRNNALCTKVHRAVKTVRQINILHVNWTFVQYVPLLSHYTHSKVQTTTAPFIDTFVDQRLRREVAILRKFCHALTIALYFVNWETWMMVDRLLQSTPYGIVIVNRVQIQAIRWAKYELTLQVSVFLAMWEGAPSCCSDHL